MVVFIKYGPLCDVMFAYRDLVESGCAILFFCRSSDPHIKEGFCTTVSLAWNHNHEVSSSDALKNRDVSDGAVQKLLDFFKAGHTPTTALDTLKYDLQEQYSAEEYARISADRSICPDVHFCYRYCMVDTC